MPESKDFILGFDPGGKGNSPRGKGNFGWSICNQVDGVLQPPKITDLAIDAWDAIGQVKKALKSLDATPNVLAAGIDAPLLWSKKGNREVDDVLEKVLEGAEFPAPKNGGRRVQAVNSLRGACVVQGALLAKYLRDTWNQLLITESHPKALCHLLCYTKERAMVKRLTEGVADYKQYATRCLCGCGEADKPKASLADHKRDATLSAISAWAAIQPNLPNWRNLYDDVKKPDRIKPFNIPVSYWMPTRNPPHDG